MGALFTAASSMRLEATAPVTVLPFTLMAWVRLTALAASIRRVISLSTTADVTEYHAMGMTDTEITRAQSQGSGDNMAANGLTIDAGVWTFLVCRFLTTTNNRISSWSPTTITHGSSAGPSTVATPTVMTIGGRRNSAGFLEPWDGDIAEYTLLDSDVYPDSAADLTTAYLYQLAFGGPFSIPRLLPNIVEHRTFRGGPPHVDQIGEVYQRRRVEWTNTGAAALGPHPPLPTWRPKPIDFIRNAIV